MGKILLLTPFLIELFGDWWLIKHGRKDIPSWARVIMMAVAVIALSGSFTEYLKASIIALLPYCFFDPALNLLRGLNILYQGKTKAYDRFLAKFDVGAVFLARIALFYALIIIYCFL